jgi:hypothetical protein
MRSHARLTRSGAFLATVCSKGLSASRSNSRALSPVDVREVPVLVVGVPDAVAVATRQVLALLEGAAFQKRQEVVTPRATYEEIRDYLGYYDTKQRHSSLGYLTLWEFELSQK